MNNNFKIVVGIVAVIAVVGLALLVFRGQRQIVHESTEALLDQQKILEQLEESVRKQRLAARDAQLQTDQRLREITAANQALEQRYQALLQERNALQAEITGSRDISRTLSLQLQQEAQRQRQTRAKLDLSIQETQKQLRSAQTQLDYIKKSIADTEQRIKTVNTQLTELKDSLSLPEPVAAAAPQ